MQMSKDDPLAVAIRNATDTDPSANLSVRFNDQTYMLHSWTLTGDVFSTQWVDVAATLHMLELPQLYPDEYSDTSHLR